MSYLYGHPQKGLNVSQNVQILNDCVFYNLQILCITISMFWLYYQQLSPWLEKINRFNSKSKIWFLTKGLTIIFLLLVQLWEHLRWQLTDLRLWNADCPGRRKPQSRNRSPGHVREWHCDTPTRSSLHPTNKKEKKKLFYQP